jgi:hypothetical protein
MIMNCGCWHICTILLDERNAKYPAALRRMFSLLHFAASLRVGESYADVIAVTQRMRLSLPVRRGTKQADPAESECQEVLRR